MASKRRTSSTPTPSPKTSPTFRKSDRYDVVLANPPFGGKERPEVQQNFPIRTGETAFLFLQHFIKILRAGGRGGIVIKNTFLSNTDNASVSLRKLLLESCNLHTVLDCPGGTFQGAGVKTVVLFFEKGAPTRKVWFYQLDPGRNLGKTNPLNDDDLAEFVKLQKTFADSPKSWSVDAKTIDQHDVRPLREEPERRRGNRAPHARGDHEGDRRPGRRERGSAGEHQGAAMKPTRAFYEDIRSLIHSARATVARGVDLVQVHANFEIGRRIVEEEQRGKSRAAYGQEVITLLAERLVKEFGRGYSRSSLEYMRKFYLLYQQRAQIPQSVIGKLKPARESRILRTVSARSAQAQFPGRSRMKPPWAAPFA